MRIGRPSHGIQASTLVLAGGLVLVLALAGLVFVGGQTSTILSTVGSAIPPGPATSDGALADTAGSADTVDTAGAPGDPGFSTVMDAARPDLLVIRIGSLELRVDDVPGAVDRAARTVEALGGYVSASEQSGAGDRRTATVTYRVPVEAWDRTVVDLRGLALDVVRAETKTQDVTAEVVDLDARVANLRATEAALQAIMTGATDIKDVLAVQAELTAVRGQIEEATARANHLRDQAAFSTLTVTFTPPPVAATVAAKQRFDPQAEVDRSTAQLVRVVQRAASFGIWFAIVALPLLLTLAVGLVVAAAVVVGARRVVGARAGRAG